MVKTNDRAAPTSIESEMGVLGSMLLDPNCCDDIAQIVTSGDFFDVAHALLFQHAMKLRDTTRLDETLLLESLDRSGELKKVGGVAHIGRCIRSVANAAHAVYYATIVREKAILRELIAAGSETISDAYQGEKEPQEQIAAAEQRIFEVAERGLGAATEAKPARDSIRAALDRLETRSATGYGDGVRTGFQELDKMTGGMRAGEVTVVAARPSQGKTALAVNIAEYAAIDGGNSVLFVSLEMSELEVADRLMASRAHADLHKMRNGMLTPQDRQSLVGVASEIADAALWIDDAPSRNMSQIGSIARKTKRRHGLDLIVVDYLQLVDPDNPRDARQEQVAKVSRRMKTLARELDTPVLVLAQLNRQADSPGAHPRLSQLRESGAIEQDADVVLFIHRPGEYDKDKAAPRGQAEEAELIIAKQRNGPQGIIKVNWFRECARFGNRASAWQEAKAVEECNNYEPAFSDWNDRAAGDYS